MRTVAKLAVFAALFALIAGGAAWVRNGIRASQEEYAALHAPFSVFEAGRRRALDRKRLAAARQMQDFLNGARFSGARLEALNRKLAPAGLASDGEGRITVLGDREWARAVADLAPGERVKIPSALEGYISELQRRYGIISAGAVEEEEEEEEEEAPMPAQERAQAVEARRRKITIYLYKAFSSTINRASERGNRATIWSDYLDSTMDEYGRRMDQGARP